MSETDEMGRVQSAWGRVDAWLARHAPASSAVLRPPAGDAQIAAAETAMQVRLPAALAAWYRLHDGMEEATNEQVLAAGVLPAGMRLLALEELVVEHRTHLEWDWPLEEKEEKAGILPFARTPGDISSGWYVDARKAEPSFGNLGRWYVDLGDELYPSPDGWPLAAWLTEVASALEGGRCLVLPDGTEESFDWPAVHQGRLMWLDPRDPRLLPEGAMLLDGPM